MKFKKLKNGKYLVNCITTYEEVIIKLNLFKKQNFNIDKIIKENQYYDEYCYK